MKYLLTISTIFLFAFSPVQNEETLKEFAHEAFQSLMNNNMEWVKKNLANESELYDFVQLSKSSMNERDLKALEEHYKNTSPEERQNKNIDHCMYRFKICRERVYNWENVQYDKEDIEIEEVDELGVPTSSIRIFRIPFKTKRYSYKLTIPVIKSEERNKWVMLPHNYDLNQEKILTEEEKKLAKKLQESEKSKPQVSTITVSGDAHADIAPPMEQRKYTIEEPKPKPERDHLIFNFVEQMPEFPGGEKALKQYIEKNLNYPKIAMENGIEGNVIVSFVVELDGSLSNTKVVRDLGGGCGQEALRLLKNMPKWIPGKQNGQTVRCEFVLPVGFGIE